MMCLTPIRSTANWITDRQLRSVCTTTLPMLRWTKTSPGARPVIWLAGTRLSEQPIHRYSGACWRASLVKNDGSWRRISSAQARLFLNRWSSGASGMLTFRQEIVLGLVRHEGREASRPPRLRIQAHHGEFAAGAEVVGLGVDQFMTEAQHLLAQFEHAGPYRNGVTGIQLLHVAGVLLHRRQMHGAAAQQRGRQAEHGIELPA